MTALFILLGVLQEKVDRDPRCMECHETAAEEWKASVHGPAKAGCVECHGTDLVDPKKSRPHLYVETFHRGTKRTNGPLCARCHRAEFEAFDRSAHGEDARDPEGKVRACLSCHEAHGTARAEPAGILAACRKCHGEGSRQRKAGETYVELGARLAGEARRLGPLGPAAKPAVDEALAVLGAARISQHACAYASIGRDLAASAASASSAYNRLDGRDRRTRATAAALALAGVAAAAAWAGRKLRRKTS
jgi:hypothetical protein